MTASGQVEEGRGAAGQALALVSRGREVWGAMPTKRRSRLMAGLVVLATACALVAWWGGRTDWKTLYSGLEGRDLQQVQSVLAAANISYQATPDGLGVQVPVELLDKARLEVATKGMPQSGRMGFELFDKPNWVGSEFDEKVNYQRALEGELEHTIATIGAVRSARVHLVLPKESLFTSEAMPAKASVVLKLRRSQMAKPEVESIRNLVSGAVEGLTPDQVVLVDADGKVNFTVAAGAAQGIEAEQVMEQKLVAMLEPLAGRDNVRATVNILYDDGTLEKTDEVVDPANVTPLTTEKHDQVTGAAQKAAGIPGTASNTAGAAPEGAKVAPVVLPVFPLAAAQQQTNHEESSTFAVTRHTVHEAQGPGRVVRVSAAVVVNDRAVTEGAGTAAHQVWRARTAEEMKRMEALAQAAVGFDIKRGDSVVMQNVSFEANHSEVPSAGLTRFKDQAEDFLRSQPDLIKTLSASVLAMLLVMVVVRPVAKQTLALLREPALLTASEARSGLLTSVEVPAPGESGISQASGGLGGARDEAAMLDYVTAHIEREPTESTRLLGSWIDASRKAKEAA